MNKTIMNFYHWCAEYKNQAHDIALLLLTVLFGTFIKIYKEPDNPNKWRFSRFISEFLISFLIAVTLYQINEIWLGLPKLFIMTLCVWGGSLSTRIYNEVDEFLSSLFESLKNFIGNRFQSIVIVLGIGFLFLSCGSGKPITSTQNKESVSITDTSKDSVVIKNLAIMDSLKVAIEKVTTTRPECDSLTNAKIEEILSKINTKKASGENGYGFYFDKLKRELVAYAKMGETKNEKIQNNYSTQKTIVEKETIKIPVKYTPKWLTYLAWLGGILLVYNIYKIILCVQKKSSPLL
jgi:hypothetical protein